MSIEDRRLLIRIHYREQLRLIMPQIRAIVERIAGWSR